MRTLLVFCFFVSQVVLAATQIVADCTSDYGDHAVLSRKDSEYRLSFQYADETQTLAFVGQPVRVEYSECAARLRYYEHSGIARVDILIKDPKGKVCVTPEIEEKNVFAIFSVFNGNPGYIATYAECTLTD
ncbi:MAG: hypothetical protein KDD51_13715 [Bdellovibrionales bacterium]|nr:hypothetical protein [Bdellovibrionales bacterium]